jgi:hypothetical protein
MDEGVPDDMLDDLFDVDDDFDEPMAPAGLVVAKVLVLPEAGVGDPIGDPSDVVGILELLSERTTADLSSRVADGASVTVARFLQGMCRIQGTCRVSQAAMGQIFYCVQLCLPHENAIPSYTVLLGIIKRVMSRGERRYDMCPEDCISFTDQNEHSTKCLVCAASRYRGAPGSENTGRFPVPVKVFMHRPVETHVRLLFEREDTGPHMPLDPRTGYDPASATWGDIKDSQGWVDKVLSDPVVMECLFTAIILLASDGFPVFQLSNGYSVEAIVAVVLNLPPWLRVKAENFLFLGLVPGPKKAKSLQAYLAIIVSDLKLAYGRGFWVRNRANGNIVESHVKLIQLTADMPGLCSILNMMNKETKFCCNKCKIRAHKSTSLRRNLIDDPTEECLRRTSAGLARQGREIEALRDLGVETRTDSGINGASVLKLSPPNITP